MNFIVSNISPFGVMIKPMKINSRVQDLDLKMLHNYFLQEQLIVLRGFQTFKKADEFSSYCELWGEISIWPFGKVLELTEQDGAKDHIFDNSYIPMHWDGMYRPQVPEYQIFHCVEAPLPGQGGRTAFSNTILALKHASLELKHNWKNVIGIYKRKMEYYNSKTISPIITKHPFRDFSVIRYNEPPSKEQGNFINPPELEFTGLPETELDLFHKKIKELLYSPSNLYAHEWQQGDVVITDNFSLLHGREKFVSKSPRHLQRVQVLSDPPFNNPALESYQ